MNTTMRYRLFTFIVLIVVFSISTVAFIVGQRHACHELHINNIRRWLANNPIQFDEFGRLNAYPGKTQVQCPMQTEQTAVLLAFGQSNSANYGGQRYRAHDSRIVNFFNGKCYVAESPLLGAGGGLGESWTLLGNRLVDAGLYQQVVLIPAGIGASGIQRWATGGDLNKMLLAVLDDAAKTFRITHVLWHQGESDYGLGTSETVYISAFQSIVASLRGGGVAAPIYLATASFEDHYRDWTKTNPVTMAQAKIPDGKTIFAGPDTDADIVALDRYDGTHFGATGQEKFAARWMDILRRRP